MSRWEDRVFIEPTFVATYDRLKWAAYKMPCGHTAADYDSAGRCMACAMEAYLKKRDEGGRH